MCQVHTGLQPFKNSSQKILSALRSYEYIDEIKTKTMYSNKPPKQYSVCCHTERWSKKVLADAKKRSCCGRIFLLKLEIIKRKSIYEKSVKRSKQIELQIGTDYKNHHDEFIVTEKDSAVNEQSTEKVKHHDPYRHANKAINRKQTFSLIRVLHASFLLGRLSRVAVTGTPVAGFAGGLLLISGCRICCLGPPMYSSSLS